MPLQVQCWSSPLGWGSKQEDARHRGAKRQPSSARRPHHATQEKKGAAPEESKRASSLSQSPDIIEEDEWPMFELEDEQHVGRGKGPAREVDSEDSIIDKDEVEDSDDDAGQGVCPIS